MNLIINQLYQDVSIVLGNGKDLTDECETTTCYTIASLSEKNRKVKKVEGTFDGNGHFWCELNGEIVDLSVEQFGYSFEFPVSKERKELYKAMKKSTVTSDLLEDCKHISSISGFTMNSTKR